MSVGTGGCDTDIMSMSAGIGIGCRMSVTTCAVHIYCMSMTAGVTCGACPRSGRVKNRPTVITISGADTFFIITAIGIKSAAVTVALISVFAEKRSSDIHRSACVRMRTGRARGRRMSMSSSVDD